MSKFICCLNAVVIVGFTEKYYEMVAGELKDVCVSAEGELERTVSLNMSVMEQHGIILVYCIS